MALTLTSSAFNNGQVIPTLYTCDGEDLSPPLRWSAAPAETQSFVLIVDDPDAPHGVWTHWVVFNIPGHSAQIAQSTKYPIASPLPASALEGENSWEQIGYRGPCPPPGKQHHYMFTLYALNAVLNLTNAVTAAEVLAAAKPHVVASTQLMGTYQRSAVHD